MLLRRIGIGMPVLIDSAGMIRNTGEFIMTTYTGENLNRVAFPLGGIGAGMICLEGTGALSHVSLRHRPAIFNATCMFSALCIRGDERVARVLEGPVTTLG